MYDRMVRALYDLEGKNPISVNINILHSRKLLKTLTLKFTGSSCSMMSAFKTVCVCV